MRNFILFLILIIAGTTSCEPDNYIEPTLHFSGSLIDKETQEPLENGGPNEGARIFLYEGNSSQPITMQVKPDGSFLNTRLFPATYRYIATGPFLPLDTSSVTISGNTETSIAVTPNLRVTTEIINVTGTSATVKVAFQKISTATLNNVSLSWSSYPRPNNFVFPEGGNKILNVSGENLTSGEKTFEITGLKSKTTYYIRSGARTANPGNYYNYSQQTSITTK